MEEEEAKENQVDEKKKCLIECLFLFGWLVVVDKPLRQNKVPHAKFFVIISSASSPPSSLGRFIPNTCSS